MRNSVHNIKNRREQIIDLLNTNQNNGKSVKFLSDTFQVSEMTIRRDLQALENAGLVNRFHGGAVLTKNEELISPDNSIYIGKIKKEIAKKAAEYIIDNSTVYINSGSTALNIVNYLEDLSLVLISNNLKLYLKETSPNITTIITGGEIRYPKDILVGDLTVNTLSSMQANIAIMSCSGVSAEKGVSTNNIHEARINKLMIDNTHDLVILLADHRKIGLNTNFIVSNINDIDILITDIYSDNEAIRKIEASGITVIQVDI